MKERGIIFNGDMVRATLDGLKTQTRRVVANVSPDNCLVLRKPTKTKNGVYTHVLDAPQHDLCPFGKVGDRLWVRETSGLQIRRDALGGTGEFRVYRASNPDAIRYKTASGEIAPIKWIPSIHMPRYASRILLEITDVRVERLNDISEEDAIAEGLERYNDDGIVYYGPYDHGDCRPEVAFGDLWKSIYGAESWDVNPWVWAITFRRIEGD
ncbi:hypothetical protein [Pectobacterium odoriferum]|uniref:hypothetical protein n=1 Tax=Pectobacterium odoriferum TaxID=78398 RepID=UPI00052B045F|nr:hypothetical protein [Pectobacterium odoriferum]AIU88306.1 phage family protein [Pectobacterium odoriferum]POE20451.1 hypothetical protein BV918_01915 [Pectobacterium odoriferum]POE37171.1 hypothetical protein BV922_01910 [Pectobacterium odoriferum]